MNYEEEQKFFQRVGERIQYVRKVNKITLEELSKRTGLSIKQLQKWKCGESGKLPAIDIYSISRALEVEISYLFSFEREDSIKRYFLAYELSLLPKSIQNHLLATLDCHPTEKMYTVEFWNRLLCSIANDKTGLLEKLKIKLLELADEYES